MTILFKNRNRRKRLLAEINMTSMIDTMSLLLIVFMASAPLMTTGVNVDLPKTEPMAISGDEKAINISIDRAGKIFVGKEEIKEDALRAKLLVLHQQNPNLNIVINGDQAAQYGQIVRVMATLKGMGFTRVGLKTEPAAPAARRR
ncbi:MAG: biopolymer transporter ExbD [Alphaproteobacteria bacterium]|nr:biopolymer transporter ExbD [Alphaproteobacteria bacterium]